MVAARPNEKHRKSSVWTKFVPKDVSKNVIPADEHLSTRVRKDLTTRGKPRSRKNVIVAS